MRSTVHTKHLPTKEEFYPATAGDDSQVIGAHPGYQIDSDGELCAIEVYIPHDFAELQEFSLMVIPVVADAVNQTIDVSLTYGRIGQMNNAHQVLLQGRQYSGTILSLVEIPIEAVSGLAGGLEAGDYVGVLVSGTALTSVGVIGVRLRYKYR